jgi:hypothetical protein
MSFCLECVRVVFLLSVVAGCLGSQELQPFVSGKTQAGARFSPFKGENNTIRRLDVAVKATLVP